MGLIWVHCHERCHERRSDRVWRGRCAMKGDAIEFGEGDVWDLPGLHRGGWSDVPPDRMDNLVF